MNMQMSEVMMSSPHNFPFILYTKMTKISHFSYENVRLALIPLLIDAECFVKICETSKCHNFLIFQPIFIRFSLLCLKIFTLSSKLKLNLLWSSSRNIGILHLSLYTVRFLSSLVCVLLYILYCK